jgi:hypothetical protein
VNVGLVTEQRFQLRLQRLGTQEAAAVRQRRLQLQHARHDTQPRGRHRAKDIHLHPRDAGYERVRTLRRRRLSKGHNETGPWFSSGQKRLL